VSSTSKKTFMLVSIKPTLSSVATTVNTDIQKDLIDLFHAEWYCMLNEVRPDLFFNIDETMWIVINCYLSIIGFRWRKKRIPFYGNEKDGMSLALTISLSGKALDTLAIRKDILINGGWTNI